MKSLKPVTVIITLLTVIMLCWAHPVPAAPQTEPSMFGRPGHFLAIINFLLDLDLTSEQKVELQTIFSETQDTIKPIITDMHELRSQMDQTFLAEEIDTAQATLQIEEMAQLKSQVTTVGLTALLQAAQVLTPEQRQTIISTRDEWKNRFMYWRNLLLKIFFG